MRLLVSVLGLGWAGTALAGASNVSGSRPGPATNYQPSGGPYSTLNPRLPASAPNEVTALWTAHKDTGFVLQATDKAKNKASDEQVKQIAQRVQKDFAQINRELEQFANQREANLSGPSPGDVGMAAQAQDQDQALGRLDHLQASAFDHQYMTDILGANDHMEEQLQAASANTADNEARDLFASMTATLEEDRQAEQSWLASHKHVGQKGS
jgi:predicted outer membrane protein